MMKPFVLQAVSHFLGTSSSLLPLSSSPQAFIPSISVLRKARGGFKDTTFIPKTLSTSSNRLAKSNLFMASYTSDDTGDDINTFEPSPDDLKETDGNSINANNNNNVNNIINDKDMSNKLRKEVGKDKNKKPSPPIYAKMHSMTICMVPQPKNKNAWKEITKARTELRDPGLFRWPPHVNILYPFIDILNPKMVNGDDNQKDNNDDTNNASTHVHDINITEAINQSLALLKNAVEKCDPFHVSLDSLGTFGGKNRGVLFLVPRSFRQSQPSSFSSSMQIEDTNEDVKTDGKALSEVGDDINVDSDVNFNVYIEPLVELQSILQTNFPECSDQRKGGKYVPHMTLSHFPSLESALEAQEKIESWWETIEFEVDEVYVLRRAGDGGQFKIVATLPLGGGAKGDDDNIDDNNNIQIHDPPLAFPDMPAVEEDWVHEERMKLKERRNGNGNRRRRSGRRKKNRIDRGPSRSVDTPEEIAKKRAERAAKRERLAREVELLEQAIRGD